MNVCLDFDVKRFDEFFCQIEYFFAAGKTYSEKTEKCIEKLKI